MPCEHRKIYSGERFTTGIPMYAWICGLCGAQDTDTISGEPPRADRKAFAAALLAFHADDPHAVRWARMLDPV